MVQGGGFPWCHEVAQCGGGSGDPGATGEGGVVVP